MARAADVWFSWQMERRIRIAAAAVAIVYIAIQGFQELVFRAVGEPATPAESLMLGAHPLHVARSIAMLVAMFGLMFLYGAVCLQRARERPVLAGFAFLAFVLFGLLEIGLRSVELIWTQIDLPAQYAMTHDPAILERVVVFEAVQHALYLPLGGAVLCGSVLVVWLFSTGRRIDRIAQAVFTFNALRNFARMLTVYVGIPLFPSAAYEAVYFAMVVVFYLPLAYWFVKRGAPSSPIIR